MSGPAGRYETSIQGNRVFIPHPLPPRLEYSRRLSQLVEETTHLTGRVEMCRLLL
jgi:hypothetical protein